MKKIILLTFLVVLAVTSCAVETPTDSVEFQTVRRIVFHDTVTGEDFLTVEGRCTLEVIPSKNTALVNCKVSPRKYKKHGVKLSDGMIYYVDVIDGEEAYPYEAVYHKEK